MSSNSTPFLIVESLTIRRNDELLVHEFFWTHGPGRPAWIAGPNGAGKSTLLRVLAGIASPDGGSVRHLIDELPVQPRTETLSYYSPSMGLPPEARAGSFAALAALLVDAAIPLAPDRALGAKRCAKLSTGEEKRLLLGPLLARGAPFVLLDEPYEHLSREARDALTREILRIAASAVVVVATNQPIPSEASGPVVTLSVTEAPSVA